MIRSIAFIFCCLMALAASVTTEEGVSVDKAGEFLHGSSIDSALEAAWNETVK